MLEYLKKIISSKSEESSKRFIAVWTMVLVTSIVVSAILSGTDYVMILTSLISFICILLGISTYESVKHNKNKSDAKDKE